MNTHHASTHIALLPGDGIGPEVTAAAVSCLEAVAEIHGYQFHFSEHAIGGGAIDAFGPPTAPSSTASLARQAARVLSGSAVPKASMAPPPMACSLKWNW